MLLRGRAVDWSNRDESGLRTVYPEPPRWPRVGPLRTSLPGYFPLCVPNRANPPDPPMSPTGSS